MSKVKQSRADIQKQFNLQLELLGVLSDVYDQGQTVVAKSIASSVRVIMHQTNKSHSLISQMSLEKTDFFDSCLAGTTPKGYENVKRVGSYSGLFGTGFGKESISYAPYLDDIPGGPPQTSKYVDYWNRTIFQDKNNNTFTRKEIVLAVANKDGGAHVDPELDQKYVDLARNNSLGWEGSINGQRHETPEGAELAAIRQIAHEILRTFVKEYPEKKIVYGEKSPLVVLGGMGISIGTPAKEKKENIPKVGRNEKCPCGSGTKYKRCHGK